MNRLEAKVAVVTGAAHGIGEAIARTFARHGAWVLLADIDEDDGAAVAADIRAQGGQCLFCLTDVSSESDVQQACRRAAQQTGRVDVLCNNAAYLGVFHDVLGATSEEWMRCFHVSVMGTQYFTKAALPYMIAQKEGSIINIASIQAMIGCPTSVAYSATKSALIGFTLSAAHDYGAYNIRVNAICPGSIQTRISPKAGEPGYQRQAEETMLGRVGHPAEVANAALFLASNEASYVTGAILPVDGGCVAK
jgi:NAD(P)-dependent dehydrogenase (short-subunit alcohol dehydrogenase family)